jgi:5-hydroxyisourate hydrolase
MTSVSTHVLDVERGQPAAGFRVALDIEGQVLAEAITSADGRVSRLAENLEPGVYRLTFHVADYMSRQQRPAPFLQQVSLSFRISPGDQHHHVPLLLSAYACTSYRGS